MLNTYVDIYLKKINLLFTKNTLDHKLDETIRKATQSLLDQQNKAGYWLFELETDIAISTQYALMMYFMDDVDPVLLSKIANHLRNKQSDNGSFVLFPDGPSDLSLTTLAYFVLKLAGDSVDQIHMEKARDFILSQGGAAKCNALTRIILATFKQLPWHGTPFIPVEIILLPNWFPINVYTLSYWARTIIIPLSIISTEKAVAKNTGGVDILELFTVPPALEKHYFETNTLLEKTFLAIDKTCARLEAILPKWVRNHAITKATTWIEERLNGEDGLGGLMPAMLYAYEAMGALEFAKDDPRMIMSKKAMQRLLVIKEDEAYCQPAFSPVWDTAFTMLALEESHSRVERTADRQASVWLATKQLTDEPGDWRIPLPHFKGGGGWAFQFNSPHYPDIDDTALAAFAMFRTQDPSFQINIDQAAKWLRAMQTKNGGYGAYDVDNTNSLIDASPLADYISLIDPPTVDITARCVMFMAHMAKQDPHYQPTVDRAMAYLWREQEDDGSWFGRWGCNYLYGTWSTLYALEQAEVPSTDPRIQRAITWIKNMQNEDGGWGEDNMTYHNPALHQQGRHYISTSFQTAWALLGLIAAGETHSSEVKQGIEFLSTNQQADGLWSDTHFSGPGFPKALYLKYHGYGAYFPLWALARYRNLTTT